MKSATPLVLAVALAAGLLGSFVERRLHRPETTALAANLPATASIRPDDPMPALVLSGLDGKPMQLPAGFAERPLLINFWASWCAPCLAEMPELERYSREQDDNGVQVIGIALDTSEAVRGFLGKLPVHYPILLDAPGSSDASVRLGNARGVLPYSVLVGADGRIVRQKAGPFAPGEIAAWAQSANP